MSLYELILQAFIHYLNSFDMHFKLREKIDLSDEMVDFFQAESFQSVKYNFLLFDSGFVVVIL